MNVSGYTLGQLRTYDLFLDNIRIRETDIADARLRGMEEGMEKGRELASEEIMLIISELKKMELTVDQIADKFNISQEKVARYKSLIF